MTDKAEHWPANEVTPWFQKGELPTRTGLYHVLSSTGGQIYWCYYNAEDRYWGFVSYTPDGAVGFRNQRSKSQLRRWRGLNYNPNSKKAKK